MPKGPNGERRPADVVGCVVNVARIATGKIEDIKHPTYPNRAKGGRVGGATSKASLSPERRADIARDAVAVRWAAKRTDA